MRKESLKAFDRRWSNPDSPVALETVKRPPLKSFKEAYEIALIGWPRGSDTIRHQSSGAVFSIKASEYHTVSAASVRNPTDEFSRRDTHQLPAVKRAWSTTPTHLV
jgi:hypothetical protein